MSDQLVWCSRCQPSETGRDAAKRFVRETFGVERSIRWSKKQTGVFAFDDGYRLYRVDCQDDQWTVHRLAEMSKQAKGRAKARAELKEKTMRDDDWETRLEQCQEIQDLCEQVPERGEDFAASVMEKVQSIADWIEANESVTADQAEALDNMQAGVERWIR